MTTSVTKPVTRWSQLCRPVNDQLATSAAFTPADNSLLVLCLGYDTGSAGTVTFTVSSSPVLTWDERIKRDGATTANSGVSAIWTAPVTTGASTTISVTIADSPDSDFRTVTCQVYNVTGQHASPIGTTGSGTHTSNPAGNFTLFTGTAAGRAFYVTTDWSANATITSTDTADALLYSGLISEASVYKASDHSSGTVQGNLNYGGTPAANWVALEILAAVVSGNVEATPGAGALTAVGPAPTRLVDYARSPGAGAVTAAGYDPSFIERSTRYAYPSADIDAGPWTPSTGAVLYAMIDETVADDGDYIVTNTAGTAKITLKPVADPGSSAGHVVNYRIWSPVGGNATVRLVQGASTVIASWDHTGLPTTATNYSQPLSGAEADSITDYDTLHIEFEAT